MLKNIIRILPFFITTLLSIGGVELLYGVAENYFLLPKSKAAVQEAAVVQSGSLVRALEKHTNYKVILDRNLFQSYAEEPPKVVPVKENPLEGLKATSLDLILMGTISGTEENSRAIIMEKAKKQQDIYYNGDIIQGAQIKEILRAKVILTYQGKDEILDMTEAAKYRPRQKMSVAPALNRKKVINRPKIRVKRSSVSPRPKPRRVPVTRPKQEDTGSDQDSDTVEPIVEQDQETVEPAEPVDSGDPESQRDSDADGRQRADDY